MGMKLTNYVKALNCGDRGLPPVELIDRNLQAVLKSKIPQYNNLTKIAEVPANIVQIHAIESESFCEPVYSFKKSIVIAGDYKYSLKIPLINTLSRKKEIISIKKNKYQGYQNRNYTKRSVQLKQVGFGTCGFCFLITCGYDPQTDTLYVRKP